MMSSTVGDRQLPHRSPSSPRYPRVASVLLLAVLVTIPVALHLGTLRPDSVLDLHVSPDRFLASVTEGWAPGEDLGRRTGGGVAYFPVAVFFAGLRGLGLAALTVERLWFSLVLIGAAFGMRHLFRTYWEDEEPWRMSVAALLYTFNPFVLLNLASSTVLLLPYVALPWLTAQFILLARTGLIRHAVAVILITSLVATGINPTQNVIMWFACLAVVGTLLTQPRSARTAAAVLTTLAFAVLTSLWWIGPFLTSLRGGGVDTVFQTDPIEIGASQSSVREVLRMTGLWALYFGNNGVPYLRAQGYLLSNPVVAATMLAPVGACLALRRLWPDRRATALLLLIVAAVPLAVSIYPPASPGWTGLGYRWLHDQVFAFRAFRSNYKWVAVLVFAYALLLPTLLRPRALLTRPRTLAPAMGISIIVVAGAFPFFADLIFTRGYKVGTIPGYWYQAAHWLDDQPGQGRVLFTPGQPFAAYEWGRPSGDIAPLLVRRSVITSRLTSSSTPAGRELIKLTDQAISDPTVPYRNLLSMLRVAYVVQRNDLDIAVYDSPTPAEMRRFLEKQPGLRKVQSFGRLDVYRVENSPEVPLLGVSDQIDTIGTTGSIVDAVREYRPGTLARISGKEANPVVRQARASSVWNGLSGEFGPAKLFDGDPESAWVPATPGGAGEWAEAHFTRPRSISDIEIEVRRNGVDARPASLRLEVGPVVRDIEVDPSGLALASFPTVVTGSVRITIIAPAPAGGPNVGLSEARIYGDPSTPLGFARTGGAASIDLAPQGDEWRIAAERNGTYRLAGTAAVDPRASEQALTSYLTLPGVRAVRASSRWRDLAAYSPLRAFDLDPATAWVPDDTPGAANWIEIEFERPRKLSGITVRTWTEGPHAAPVAVDVLVDGGRPERTSLAFVAEGTVRVAVEGFGSTLQIKLVEAGREHGPRIGLGEIGIPGVIPEWRADAVGAELVVDGRTLALTPDDRSSLDAVVFRGVPVTVSGTLQLGATPMTIRQGDSLLGLRRIEAVPDSEPSALSPIATSRPNPSMLTATISRPARYLTLTETADPFWSAKVDGTPLRKAGTGNGYAQVWALDGRTGSLRVSFDDRGRTSTWALLSLASAALAGLVAVGVLVRRRRAQ